MLHDYGSWTHGYDLLLRTLARAADALPLKFNNEPLPSLRAPGALSGLQNGGATCYMNATFQQLFMQPTVRQLVLSSPGVHPEDQADSVFHQFQQMFAHLAAGVEPWYEPQGFWRAFKDYEGRPVNIREHQDAYEFFTRLQDSIDEHLRSLGAPRAIHAALGGTFAQVITVAGRPELRSQRDEDFYQISLDVRGKKGLEESLESYVAVELMDGQNQWHCEALNAKVDAEKRTLIRSLPHTLMLHLKRFEWDYETFSRWKVKDKFEFPLSLDMKPFTEEGAAAQAAAGDDSAGNGGDLRPDEYYQYELRGIVVHSGTAFAGHYYSYIKDRSNGVWYCFDDTSVELWDVTCLEVDCFGGKYVAEGTTQEFDRPHSAYMLVYERVAEMAEPLNEPAATATAAAPVKLPTEPVPMDTAPANASTPTPMLTSPPVAAQPAHAPLQLAAAAAAIPGAYDAVLSADPAIQTMLVTRNTEAIAGYHILGLDFLHFFNLLCDEVRCALQSGRPRKVARSAGLTSPGNGGDGGAAAPSPPSRLIALGANKSPVAQALVLCWDYYCRIVARASEDLSLEISNRRIRGVRGGLLHCSKHLDGAMTLVEYASEDETAPYLVQALGCPIDDARETVRYALLDAVNCLRSAYGAEAAYNEVHPIIEYFVTDVLGKIGPRLRPIFVWEEVLSLVATIVDSDDSYAVMLQPHLGIVLNLGGPLTAHWNRMPPDEHMHYDFGSYYVMLLSALLRTHNPGSLASKRYANAPNPFCIPVGGPFTHPLLPQLAWDFLFPPGAPEDALSKVLLPGAVSTQSAAQLLKWIIWNNNAKYVDVVCAVLNHINRDLLRTEEVAAEVMVLAEAMAVADAQQRDRLE